MAGKHDGGPAFPSEEGPGVYASAGMSLRDWFAGQALIALCSSEIEMPPAAGRGAIRDALAEMSYEFADAMLAERNKGD